MVFWFLVLEREFTTGSEIVSMGLILVKKGGGRGTNRLGSIDLPAALLASFFLATGPMLARWSELGEVMMVSHITAWFSVTLPAMVAEEEDGHSAVM